MTVSDGLCLKIQFFRSVGFKDRLEKGEGRRVVGGGGRMGEGGGLCGWDWRREVGRNGERGMDWGLRDAFLRNLKQKLHLKIATKGRTKIDLHSEIPRKSREN